MTNSSPIRLTYEDYAAIPDDGKRHQLVDGEHYVTPSPFTRHQRIVGRLFADLRAHLEANPVSEVFIAPFDVLLEVGTVVQPDVLVVLAARAEIVTVKHIVGAPNLVVEVLSDGSRRLDEKVKLGAYERCGVDECWYLDPEMDLARAYRRRSEGFDSPTELKADREESLSSALLPGLAIDLRAAFA
jgi:Uma2 family endonuclease